MNTKKQNGQIGRIIWATILILGLLFSTFGRASMPALAQASEGLHLTSPGEIPLFSGLQWKDLGPEIKKVSFSDQGDAAELSGHSYISEEIIGKPNHDIRFFYSAGSLSQIGWQFVTDSLGVEKDVSTYFQSPNRYLVVEYINCNENDPDIRCITVWISSPELEVPVPILPSIPEPNASTNVTGSTESTFSNPLLVPTFSQNDSAWKSTRMGYPDTGYPTACDFCTIGGYGCFLSSYSMLYNYYQSGYTNPSSMNNNLIYGSVRFASNGQHCNNMMPGGAPYAPSGVSRGFTYINDCTQVNCIDQANIPIIQNEINSGRPLMAYVHYSTNGYKQHMVVITGYSGSTYYINDPWNGAKLTFSTGALGGYVVDEIRQWIGTPPTVVGCDNPSPNSDQIGLYTDDNYCGTPKILGVNEYPNPGALGIANDSVSSIKVGSNVKATLCKDDNYYGGCEDFLSDDPSLGNNSIGNDSVSSAKVATRPGTSLPSDYGFCAEEGQRCAFSGTAQIYFGANSQFVGPRTYTDGVDCNNNVFGDPIPGTHKQCFIKGGRPEGSTFCANESGMCSFGNGNVATVYYGVSGRYYSKTNVVSSIACDNNTFGDPFSGQGKACYYVITGTSIPAMPSNTAITNPTTTSLTLTWQDNSSNESGFKIYRWGYDGTQWTFIYHATVDPNRTSYTQTNLDCGSSFNYYEVSAYNGAGESQHTAWVQGTTLPCDFNKTYPANGATGQTLNPTLSWEASNGAESYEYCIDTTNDNACSNWTSNGTSTSKALIGLSAGTTYYWHVRAVNSSGATYSNGSSAAFWSFTTAVNPPGVFNKTMPSNGAVNQSTSPTLSWTSSSGATSYEYCIDTTNDNACSNWVSNGSATSKPLSGLSQGTTYYWQVRAINTGGITYADGSASAFWSFTTTVNSPGAFNKNSPQNSAIGQSLSPTLSWGASSGATSYEYCYDTTNDNVCSNWISNGAATSAPINGLSPVTTYYWHVRAINAGGTTYSNGANTAFWSFTTQNNQVDCPATINNWKGEYWANPSLTGTPTVCRDDVDVNFDWGYGSPDLLIPEDNFSARWTRTVNFTAGTYRFYLGHDDGARLFIDDMNIAVLDVWPSCCVVDSVEKTLTAGNHVIKIEYFENGGAANIKFWWEGSQNILANPTSNVAQTGGDKNGYEVNPTNAYPDDSVFAMDVNSGTGTSTSCTDKKKDSHVFYNYGINLPSASTIQGIEILLDAKADSTVGSPKICVQLSWDGGASWTTVKSTSTLTTGELTYILGSPTDTWGRTWTTANLSNTNLRVRIIDVASNVSRDFSLDRIAVRVTYK